MAYSWFLHRTSARDSPPWRRYADIPSQYPTLIQHNKDYHHVLIQKDTLLSRYFPSQIKVNSSHHQNIKDVPKTLKISAISEDGLIEGIENNQILAVQWHPERMDEQHQKQFIQYILDFIQNHSWDDFVFFIILNQKSIVFNTFLPWQYKDHPGKWKFHYNLNSMISLLWKQYFSVTAWMIISCQATNIFSYLTSISAEPIDILF